ncbi:hypothetical protein [Actinoplanes sp. NPDC026619]|uniref:DUF7134 domain-containing protein n=1 Tax=Actinoplanes sp. NPDC026619 TaxID=3155798 RepID=UPI0033CA693F
MLDAGLMLLTLALPLTSALDGAGPAAVTLLTLAAVAHSAPLLARRRHPWPVLIACALTAWLSTLLVATGVAPGGEVFFFGPAADLAAVYAVAARAARSWIAPIVSLAGTAAAFGLLATIEQPAGGGPGGSGGMGGGLAVMVFLLSAALFAGLLAAPFGGAWLAGHLVRKRRERRHDRERGLVAVEGMRAEARARHEHARIADGLRSAVLEQAARVPAAAEQADLAGVLEAARAALAAMRGLLDGLGGRPGRTEPEVSSSPSV